MQHTLKSILIDDELGNIENLQSLLNNYCPQIKIAGTATHLSTAKKLLLNVQPDLVFLDIQMGKETGFDLLKSIKDRNFEVIFITAYDKYGIQAVKFNALDYLLKPVDIDELILSVKKAEERILQKRGNIQLDALMEYLKKKDPKTAKIALPQREEIRFVPVNEIVRCEAKNSYTFVYLQNKEKILVSKLLKEYCSLLEPCGFIRPHQSHLINPVFIKSWLREDGGSILLKNGIKVPVSRPRREKVKLLLQEI